MGVEGMVTQTLVPNIHTVNHFMPRETYLQVDCHIPRKGLLQLTFNCAVPTKVKKMEAHVLKWHFQYFLFRFCSKQVQEIRAKLFKHLAKKPAKLLWLINVLLFLLIPTYHLFSTRASRSRILKVVVVAVLVLVLVLVPVLVVIFCKNG